MEDRMTSKLVVNTIEADTGISSVSFASSISLSSTSKFFFSDAGIDIGPDTNINRPATGVLGFNINGSEKVRIDSSGIKVTGITTTSSYFNSVSGYRVANHPVVGYVGFTAISGGSYAATLGSTGTSTLRHTQIYGGGSVLATFDGVNNRLGIGTEVPGRDLEVGGEISATDLFVTSGGDTAKNNISGKFSHGGINSKSLVIGADPNNVGGNTRMQFDVDGGEKMRITSQGRIGIGTDDPSAKLEVRDSGSTGIIVRSNGTQSTDTNKALRVRNNSDTNTFSVSHKGLLEIARGEEGTYLEVGGDDASNGRALTFTSSTGGTGSNGALHTLNAKSGNGAIALATAGTERFRVDRDGYVTKSNTAAFNVKGTNMTRNNTSGYICQFSNDTSTGCYDLSLIHI